MTCARCGLSLRLHGARLNLDRCPRCFAFAGVSVPLRASTVSMLPSPPAPAPELLPSPSGPAPDPPAPATAASFGHLVVSTEYYADATVIALHGKLDIASQSCLDQALRRAYATGSREILIDLRELEFIDATGMKVLLRAREYTLEHGTRLFLTPGPPTVQRMFQLTGTLGLFSFRA
jgi:anti-sigma B factor antagonist